MRSPRAPEGVGDGGVEVELEALGVGRVEAGVAEGVAAEPLAVRLGRHEQPGQPGQAEPFLGAGDGAEEAGGFEVAAGVGGASGEHEQPEVTILGATPDQGCGRVLGVAKAALAERRSARHDEGSELRQVARACARGGEQRHLVLAEELGEDPQRAGIDPGHADVRSVPGNVTTQELGQSLHRGRDPCHCSPVSG